MLPELVKNSVVCLRIWRISMKCSDLSNKSVYFFLCLVFVFFSFYICVFLMRELEVVKRFCKWDFCFPILWSNSEISSSSNAPGSFAARTNYFSLIRISNSRFHPRHERDLLVRQPISSLSSIRSCMLASLNCFIRVIFFRWICGLRKFPLCFYSAFLFPIQPGKRSVGLLWKKALRFNQWWASPSFYSSCNECDFEATTPCISYQLPFSVYIFLARADYFFDVRIPPWQPNDWNSRRLYSNRVGCESRGISRTSFYSSSVSSLFRPHETSCFSAAILLWSSLNVSVLISCSSHHLFLSSFFSFCFLVVFFPPSSFLFLPPSTYSMI